MPYLKGWELDISTLENEDTTFPPKLRDLIIHWLSSIPEEMNPQPYSCENLKLAETFLTFQIDRPN